MKYIIFFLFLIFSFNLSAQETEIVKAFDSLVQNSNSWTKYRVIKKDELSTYKNVLIQKTDSLNKSIAKLNSKITDLEASLKTTENENKALKAEVEKLKNAKDEISVVGIALPKSTYSVLVWSIILVLVLVLIFVIIKLRNRNIVTQEVKENLENTTKEFEEYKHRAIEKQQKLGRDLLDAQKLAQSRNTKK
jgi:septal ring factor EnvC (AmiA/AmiB activator)